MAARRKAKKPKGRARTRKPKRTTASRVRARKVPRRPAARVAVPKRVTELEAENRRLRDEIAELRMQLAQEPARAAEPVEPDEELPLG